MLCNSLSYLSLDTGFSPFPLYHGSPKNLGDSGPGLEEGEQVRVGWYGRARHCFEPQGEAAALLT